ncbi:hypothetical protein REPUB_Repub19eG0124300 [Reevesia pubescens]
MSKYKKMHGKKNSKSNVSVVVDQSGDDEAIKHRDAGENNNATLNTGIETDEAKDLQSVKENHAVHSQTPEPYIDSSTSLPMQDKHKQDGNRGYESICKVHKTITSYSTNIMRLKTRDKRFCSSFSNLVPGITNVQMKVMMQLNNGGTSCTSQDPNLIPTSQASHSAVMCSCCPYVCQSLVTPCTSYSCCSLGRICVGKTRTEPNGAMVHGNLPSVIDSDIFKIAMGAAEKAISSMTTIASINPNVNKQKKE